jgi:hypothetical protein
MEAKLYLYALTKSGTFCARAPSTLCSEFFFSSMQEMDPWGQGILTTDGVKKHISDFTTVTAIKMEDNRFVTWCLFISLNLAEHHEATIWIFFSFDLMRAIFKYDIEIIF